MTDWMKMGTDVVVGGVGGVASKMVEDWDADREIKAGKPLGFFEEFGNYVDYGIPILGIVASAMGYLRGDWETRVLTMGGTLAGRRATGEFKKKAVTPYRGWVPITQSPGQSRQVAPTPSPGGTVMEI